MSAKNNRTLGPPDLRGFELDFDTTIQAIGDINPAELTLNKPLTSIWRQSTWRQKFTWTKRVNGFTIDDIDIRKTAGSGSFSVGELVQDDVDNRIYYLPITLTGSGEIEVSVDPEVATSGDAKSPPNSVSERWSFEAPSALDVPNISGNEGVEVILSETFDIDSHPELIDPSSGGLFLGISDMHISNDRVYFVDQIQRKREDRDEVSTLHPSAGALCSIPVDNNPATPPNIHKKYNYFTQAARSLQTHKEELHFFEGSAYHFNNEILLSTGAVIPTDEMGFVRKINKDTLEIETLGLNYQSKFPTGPSDKHIGRHLGTFSPLISHDDDLHIISQRKDFFDITGVQWIVYSNKLNQKITLLETNNKTGFQVIERLAGLTNSIIGYENGEFIFKPRTKTHAFLESDIAINSNTLLLKNLNRVHTWGASGIVYIDGELITYSSTGSNSLENLTRGDYNTPIRSHSEDTEITLIDKVIDAFSLARPVNDMDVETDGTLIYNNILVKYAENQVPRTNYLSFPAVDEQSILENGEWEFELELPLDYHQKRWATLLASQMLENYKNLKFSITLRLKRDLDIRLGDIIYLNEPIIEDIKIVGQVMSLLQDKKREETEIIVVSV